MKEVLALILIALIGGLAYAFFTGHSHSVNFRYKCGAEIPWYDAIFLDTAQCPTASGQQVQH